MPHQLTWPRTAALVLSRWANRAHRLGGNACEMGAKPDRYCQKRPHRDFIRSRWGRHPIKIVRNRVVGETFSPGPVVFLPPQTYGYSGGQPAVLGAVVLRRGGSNASAPFRMSINASRSTGVNIPL